MADQHDEAAHVADELASAMATCEGCGNMGYADSWPFVAPFTAVAGGPAVLLCQDCVQARVDNEIADEMVSEFFGEPATDGEHDGNDNEN